MFIIRIEKIFNIVNKKDIVLTIGIKEFYIKPIF